MSDYHLTRHGDPRRCSVHPGVETSSPNGMWDAPCWKCEAAMADLMEEEAEAEFMALPQAERLEIILNGAQIRSHLGDCPLVKAEPIDFSDIPF